MSNNNETTTQFKVDISELKSQFQEAQRVIKLANSEFKAATAGMDDWGKSADGVSAKITQLNKVLDAENKKLGSLEDQYKLVVKEQGENSKGAQELLIKINNQKAAIAQTEKQIKSYSSKLDDIKNDSKEAGKSTDDLAEQIDDVGEESKKTAKSADDAEKAIKDIGDEAEKSESKLGGFAKTLAGGVAKGLAGIATAAVGAVAGFLATGSATQETMEDMGKLETAFKSAGHSGETAEKSFEGMVGILGETDQSVEAVNHLAKLTKSEEELAKWTDIAAGIYGTFGDSLPIEGLTEAANETAKVG